MAAPCAEAPYSADALSPGMPVSVANISVESCGVVVALVLEPPAGTVVIGGGGEVCVSSDGKARVLELFH